MDMDHGHYSTKPTLPLGTIEVTLNGIIMLQESSIAAAKSSSFARTYGGDGLWAKLEDTKA